MFDSTPCLCCEVHCFSAGDFLPKIMKGQIKSQTCENSGHVIDEKAAWELHKTALGISECKRAAKLKLWAQTVLFFFYLDGRQCVDEVNSSRLVCLHRSLFSAPDQCTTFGNLRFPAAIASCWISVFWQCLKEEHSVRCQVKTICDRFGGEIKRRQTGS